MTNLIRQAQLITFCVLWLVSGSVFSQPPTDLFKTPGKQVPPGHYGRAAIEGDIDTRGIAEGHSSLAIQLPEHGVIHLNKTSHTNRGSGNGVWRGTSDSHDFSQAVITVHQGRVVARIVLDDKVYEIRPGKGNRHRAELLDEEAFPQCDNDDSHRILGESDFVGGDESGAAVSQPVSAGDELITMDLLSVYTPNARIEAGGDVADIEALIYAAMDNANTAFIESGVNAQYRLVHIVEASNYDNAPDTGDALGWVVNSAEVADLRNQYGADMVSVIVDTPKSCGTGYVQRTPGAGFENLAFQATDIDCAVGNLTFAHEHGHNMGMEHNFEDSSVGSIPNNASYPWSFAHYVNGSFRTVMSYGGRCTSYCPRVMRHSSPLVIYNDQPAGIDDVADNARTANLTAPIIANFRNSASNVAPIASFSYSVSDLTASFTDSSTDSEGSIDSLSWLFGDGGTSSTANPQHTYASAGTYTVSLTVTDNEGATDTASSSVTVTENVTDTIPPVISGLTAKAVEASGTTTVVGLGAPTVTDDQDSNPTVSNNAPSAFPVGITTVTWTATDAAGNSATALQTVTVSDTTSPVITAPGDISVESNEPIDVALGSPSVSDIADPNPAVSHNAPSTFPVGITTVIWTATDASGNVSTDSQTVTVTEPELQAPAAPSNLAAAVTKSGKGKNKTITAVELSWSHSSGDADHFVLERCLEVISGKGKKRTVTCNYSTFDSGVSGSARSYSAPTDEDYRYRIKAVNAQGASAFSNSVKI